MGINTRLVVYASDEKTAENACSEAFRRIAELEAIMSDYRPDSELMLFCQKAGSGSVKISTDLMTVLVQGQRVARQSNGAFDMTASPVVRLWRNARKSGAFPDPQALTSATKLVGWKNLELNTKAGTARLKKVGMQIDLGGIAKGYACDQVQVVLKKHGINSALVEMGGDIVVSNPPPDTTGWKILVPNGGTDNGPAELLFKNCAISTSGDTEQFVVIDGIQYSHIVDPRTGRATTDRVQATVIAPDGLTSDPLATACTVLGEQGAKELLRKFPGTQLYIRVLKQPRSGTRIRGS